MQTTQPIELPEGGRIEPMREADLSMVYQLEYECQQTPWSRQHFLDELQNPVASIDLYWHHQELAGFLCTWLIAGEMQIQNIATSPFLRRRGIAARLIEHVVERNKTELNAIFLEVRVSNRPAIALYKRLGFVASGRRPNYYPDSEDALLMTCTNFQAFS